MSLHPQGPQKPYTHWKVKLRFKLDALLAVPEERRNNSEWKRIVELRRRLSTNRNGTKQPKKDFCKRGHPLSGENLRILPSGGRVCRACQRLREKKDREEGRR